MNDKLIFEKALHISEPWYIEEIKFDELKKKLEININFKKGSKFYFEDKKNKISGNFKAYDSKNKTWRHLNFFEHECYIKARVPRIQIDNLKKESIKLITPPWVGKCPGFTLLFEALILEFAKYMPVHCISKLIHESDFKIWKMLNIYIFESRKNLDLSKLKYIGLDETSRKKGHNYITLFVDLKLRKTIFITSGKDNLTIKSFVKDLKLHKGNPENIEQVSMDMSPAFIKGAEENLPNAKITFDKFHLIKIINKAVDEVRKKEVETNPILKKARYCLLKNENNLKIKEKKKLDELKLSKLNLKTLRAYNIKIAFQQIYLAKTNLDFEKLLLKWYFWATHSKLEPIKKAAKTIKKHWFGVLEWFKSKINNGILEGLNSLIQAAKAKARGFKTTKNLIIVAYLVTGKFDFSKINKYLPTQN